MTENGQFLSWRRVLSGSDITIGHRQLYMLPTRMGFVFSLLLLALLAGAINYENGLSYALTFFLGAIAIVSMLYTHYNLLGVHILAGSASPVFAGQTARFSICIRNSTAKPRIQVECVRNGQEFAVVDLGAHDQKYVVLEQPATRRGRMPIGLFSLQTRFPVGLLYTWSRLIRLEQTCLVYPHPAPSGSLPFATAGDDLREQGSGNRGDDFAGLRQYQSGDSLKHVHWKAMARGQGMQTKQFGGGSGEDLWLDWSMTAETGPEAKLGRLCRWLLDAEELGLSYGLRLPALEIRPGSGSLHQSRCLQALALYQHHE